MWEANLHVWTELIEVPVAILLHFFWRVDGQGLVWVHGDHHTANVRLKGDKCILPTIPYIPTAASADRSC